LIRGGEQKKDLIAAGTGSTPEGREKKGRKKNHKGKKSARREKWLAASTGVRLGGVESMG